jgi:hypothetical protein
MLLLALVALLPAAIGALIANDKRIRGWGAILTFAPMIGGVFFLLSLPFLGFFQGASEGFAAASFLVPTFSALLGFGFVRLTRTSPRA